MFITLSVPLFYLTQRPPLTITFPKTSQSAMNLHTFIRALEQILPPSTAMKGDRIGLQLQSGRTEISSLLITMEVTDAVAEEAVRSGADCILAFHPLIFSPLTSLLETERVGRICTKLIAHGIALVIAHTNFDSHPKGTSTILAEKLGLKREGVLVKDALHEGFGMGIAASLDAPESIETFVQRVHAAVHSPVRYNAGSTDTVRRVAIVGGSGAAFIDDAIRSGADAFLTADIKYHDFHRTAGILTLLDVGHYEMEQFVPLGLERIVRTIVQEHSENLAIARSLVVPNPVRYFPNTTSYLRAQEQELSNDTNH
jgi:dinuclear metal center YbgI/SA1388 family protein